MGTHKISSGKVFDNSVKYEHSKLESIELVNSCFTNTEIKNKIVLDAGCRLGYNAYAFILKQCRLVKGIDLSEKCIEAAKKKFIKYENMQFFIGDIRNVNQLKNSQFDIVFCFGVIIYLNYREMKKALEEFIRVTKPGGIILVTFQTEKKILVRLVTYIANSINLNVYIKLIDILSFLYPFTKFIVGRKVSREYLKYDIFLSLRNLHYGTPVKIPKKYKTKVPESQLYSKKTTVMYKINVPTNKKKLLHELSLD